MNLGIYALEDGRTAKAAVRDLSGQVELTARAERSGKTITLSVSGKGKAFTVSVKGTGAIASAKGGELAGDAIRVAAGAEQTTLVIELA
ncbi:hypothetical protein D3C73_1404500 [compost metagenome]